MTAALTPREKVETAPFKFSSNNLDLIRLIAALEVAVKHGMVHLDVGERWSEWLGFIPGVPIFFFVSGFLIFRSYKNAPDIRVFASNRFLRLFPGLAVCLVACVALVVGMGYLPVSRLLSSDFWIWVAAQLTLVQFYNWEALRGFGDGVINGSVWTISVEIQFYVLTPIVAWVVARRVGVLPVLIGLFLLANVAFAFVDKDATIGKLIMVTFVPWLYMFLAGAWAGYNDERVRRLLSIRWRWLFLAYAAALAISIALGIPYLGNYISPLLFVPICALVLKAAYARPWLAHRLLRRNDVSYGVYIYHMPVFNGLIQLGLTGDLVWLLLGLALTVLCAGLSWLLVEKPALAAKRATLRSVRVEG